jgi:hypothetical protein
MLPSSRTFANKCYCFQKFVSKCRHYSKHLLKNKKYHITKNTLTSMVVLYTNVLDVNLPPSVERDDAYAKSVIDVLVFVSKNYEYLGIELIDIITIIIIVGIIRNLRPS